MTRWHPIYDILADKKGLYLSYHSWQGGTLFMLSYVTIIYPIFQITVDWKVPIYDMLGGTKEPYLLYHSWQGGTLIMINHIRKRCPIFYITVYRRGPIYDILRHSKEPNLLYNWKGGTLYTISLLKWCNPIYQIIVDKEATYIRYPSWHEWTPSITSQMTMRFPIYDILCNNNLPYFYITVDGSYLNYDILADTKLPYTLYHSSQGETLYTLSKLTWSNPIYHIIVDKEASYI